jgi:hypothetical protein
MQLSPADREIRKLVRNKATKAFLTAGADWTTDPSGAIVFPSTEAARAAVRTHQISGAELFYQFGEAPSKYDFALSF